MKSGFPDPNFSTFLFIMLKFNNQQLLKLRLKVKINQNNLFISIEVINNFLI